MKENGYVDREAEQRMVQHYEMNSIDIKPIEMASDFLDELNEFI